MKTKKLLDKNGNPIQIEQGQVRGLKEALANVGGGSGKVYRHYVQIYYYGQGDEEKYISFSFVSSLNTRVENIYDYLISADLTLCYIDDVNAGPDQFIGYMIENDTYLRIEGSSCGTVNENETTLFYFERNHDYDIGVYTITEI